jgi:hypothetical protein
VENFACPKGVTWNILSEMALQRNGTFGEVLQVIHELNRFDILHKVSGCVESMKSPNIKGIFIYNIYFGT